MTKTLWAAFLAAFLFVASASASVAQLTRSQMSGQVNSLIGPNGHGAITGQIMNGVLNNLIASVCFPDGVGCPGDIRNFGCVSGGSFDNTACINAALAASTIVYIPPGTWHVTDMLKCTNGGIIQGADSVVSIIDVGSDFNMSALGVIQPGVPGASGSIPQCSVQNLWIKFNQPDFAGMSISDIIHYPPGINADGIHDVTLGGTIRITNAWTCITMAGSGTGGSQINSIKCSDYNMGLHLDGVVAAINVGFWDEETFEMSPNQSPIFISQGASGAAIAALIGRCDGCGFGHFLTFTHGVTNNPSAAFLTGPSFAILQLDGAGANLINHVGPVKVGALYGTGYAANGKIQSDGATASTIIGQWRLADGETGCDINVSGGVVQMSNGAMTITATGASPICVTGGLLTLNNNVFSTPNTTRTAPVILQSSAGALVMTGNWTSGSSVTGDFLGITVDRSTNLVSNNSFNGWTVNLPFTTALGYYDLGDAPFAITSTPTFGTTGDFAPTSNAVSGSYFRNGDFITLLLTNTFSTNAYTTTSGTFTLVTNAPPPTQTQGCALGFLNNVTSSQSLSAYTVSNGATASIGLARFITGAVAQNIGTANVPPSVASISFTGISCSYRAR